MIYSRLNAENDCLTDFLTRNFVLDKCLAVAGIDHHWLFSTNSVLPNRFLVGNSSTYSDALHSYSRVLHYKY